ncbi:uncharacterized protein HMPREF1541_02661 [Cyphellophora europaea CBS 101466]|uniref:Vezatin n=1 Tax=Cyphellophora europaea (strain CBS 101466) TaxID=1220924 RepID=W2S492_CYPE1|nr:uncharacterized protein HMPREF1541_02661 [Cyphellophora europaea CBS 101466]ETN43502.1 hypothetical protein HMPREF1541_02661 [Cyphellophora europaea CBS 101466]
MEALVYDESPLAEILEGDASPHYESEPGSPIYTSAPQYAPRGLPRLRDKLRYISRTARSVTDASGDRFLEKFRYSIVASQLLSEDPKSRQHTSVPPDTQAIPLSVRGAATTTLLSFATAWLLHWLLQRLQDPLSVTWTETWLYILSSACVMALIVYVARRQYLKFVRQTSALFCSKLVSESQTFDESAGQAIRLIQEIEVVARGYEISSPLPPVSRLDGHYAELQCRELRRVVAKSLGTGITQFIHFHNELQPLTNVDDLGGYYHIYDLSPDDFTGAVGFANDLSTEAQESLKQLRFLFQLHTVARKFFLIDLMALRTKPSWSDVHQWRKVSRIASSLADDTQLASRQIEELINEDDVHSQYGSDFVASPVRQDFVTPEKQQSKAQVRRFEAVGNGIRALNAKARIGRDDITDLISNGAGDRVINATIAKHYEAIGSEIRTLLDEWEHGRPTMLLNVASGGRDTRLSNVPRSPLSPSPSLGGMTMVEGGGPADALRLLNGESESEHGTDSGTMDEQVFEAIVKPQSRKRMSLGVNMTREEKMAKLQEERKKRATFQEQADNTTNMLRELQMVIKHRPPHRQNSRITSV